MFKCFIKIFKKKKVKRENLETECVICLSKIEDNDFITKCNHRFHKECLNEWITLYLNKECPICRKKLGLYTLETKKERIKRIKKEIYLEQLKKKQEEEKQILQQILRRGKRIVGKRKFQKILHDFEIEINPRLEINLNIIDFSECISLTKFVREHQIKKKEDGSISQECLFCQKDCNGKLKNIDGNFFHRECYKIIKCHYRHSHSHINL